MQRDITENADYLAAQVIEFLIIKYFCPCKGTKTSIKVKI